jgi:hypothetical protein
LTIVTYTHRPKRASRKRAKAALAPACRRHRDDHGDDNRAMWRRPVGFCGMDHQLAYTMKASSRDAWRGAAFLVGLIVSVSVAASIARPLRGYVRRVDLFKEHAGAALL